jgi:ribosome biogenesis protein MAK21
LNQLKLVKEEETEENDETLDKAKSKFSSKISLPASLINTYFQIFEVAVNKGKYESGKGAKKKKDTMTQDLAMKGRLLGALLTGVNRAHPYLPSKDTGMEQHVDSLYRISHVSPPAACTQALMLLFHLAVGSSADNMKDDLQVPKSINSEGVKPISSRKDRFYRVLYTKLSDPSMFVGRQLTLFFNLIYKSMKYDNNEPRVVAFAKRLLHIAFHQAPSVISGVLFLLSEVMNYQPLLKNGVNLNVGHGHVFDSSKREPSAAFTSLDEKESEKDSNVSPSNRIAGSIWEMSLTVNHYHPTVSKFTSSVNEINYRGDPLRDFGLVPFLDKFAFKNPKSSEKITQKLKRGESVGERRSGLQGNISALSSLPVNDPNFWKEQSTVSEQDEFFKAFFTERAKRDQFKGVVRGKKQDNGNEMDALEANEEARDMDVDWDTDEEEEAFVEKLAESLMENSNEKVNYDDEDPDMGDWSDYGGSDQEEENKLDDNDEAAGESYLEKIGFTKPKGLITVLGDVSDDDSDVDKESSENEQDSSEEIDEDAADEDDRSNDDDDDDELINEFASDDLLKDENSDDDDDDDREDDNKVQKKTKKNSSEMLSMFADASDYEELITASLKEPKGTMPKRKLDEQGDANVTPVSTKSSKRKRRKRNKSNK